MIDDWTEARIVHQLAGAIDAGGDRLKPGASIVWMVPKSEQWCDYEIDLLRSRFEQRWPDLDVTICETEHTEAFAVDVLRYDDVGDLGFEL